MVTIRANEISKIIYELTRIKIILDKQFMS